MTLAVYVEVYVEQVTNSSRSASAFFIAVRTSAFLIFGLIMRNAIKMNSVEGCLVRYFRSLPLLVFLALGPA